MAEPGDWPWHVALFKEGVHVCDATLVADNWLLTTAYCFQGWILHFYKKYNIVLKIFYYFILILLYNDKIKIKVNILTTIKIWDITYSRKNFY